jgi:hypothetical protein
MTEGRRVILMSDVLFDEWIAMQQAQDPDYDYVVDYGQPKRNLLEWYEPVVTRRPRHPDPAQLPETG